MGFGIHAGDGDGMQESREWEDEGFETMGSTKNYGGTIMLLPQQHLDSAVQGNQILRIGQRSQNEVYEKGKVLI